MDAHYVHSVLRERIVEHAFVGDALRRLWQLGVYDVEVLRSEFDAGGYDLVMSRGAIMRHIQFKSVMIGSKSARTSVNLKLRDKLSGCIIWIVVRPDLSTDHYLWFGGDPGAPLPSLAGFATLKHTKGNAEGVKLERPNHRVVPRGKFAIISSLDDLLLRLFGPLEPTQLEDVAPLA